MSDQTITLKLTAPDSGSISATSSAVKQLSKEFIALEHAMNSSSATLRQLNTAHKAAQQAFEAGNISLQRYQKSLAQLQRDMKPIELDVTINETRVTTATNASNTDGPKLPSLKQISAVGKGYADLEEQAEKSMAALRQARTDYASTASVAGKAVAVLRGGLKALPVVGNILSLVEAAGALGKAFDGSKSAAERMETAIRGLNSVVHTSLDGTTVLTGRVMALAQESEAAANLEIRISAKFATEAFDNSLAEFKRGLKSRSTDEIKLYDSVDQISQVMGTIKGPMTQEKLESAKMPTHQWGGTPDNIIGTEINKLNKEYGLKGTQSADFLTAMAKVNLDPTIENLTQLRDLVGTIGLAANDKFLGIAGPLNSKVTQLITLANQKEQLKGKTIDDFTSKNSPSVESQKPGSSGAEQTVEEQRKQFELLRASAQNIIDNQGLISDASVEATQEKMRNALNTQGFPEEMRNTFAQALDVIQQDIDARKEALNLADQIIPPNAFDQKLKVIQQGLDSKQLDEDGRETLLNAQTKIKSDKSQVESADTMAQQFIKDGGLVDGETLQSTHDKLEAALNVSGISEDMKAHISQALEAIEQKLNSVGATLNIVDRILPVDQLQKDLDQIEGTLKSGSLKGDDEKRAIKARDTVKGQIKERDGKEKADKAQVEGANQTALEFLKEDGGLINGATLEETKAQLEAALNVETITETMKTNISAALQSVNQNISTLDAADAIAKQFNVPKPSEIDGLEEMKATLNKAMDTKGATDEMKEGYQEAVDAIDDRVNSINFDHTVDEISSGISSVQSLFQEGSAAYQGMETAQMALNIVKGIGAVITQLEAGDPYTAIPRAVAVAGMISQLGVQLSGGAPSAPVDPTEQRQKTQGTGTVLGDPTAKSDSIENSNELIAEATQELVDLNRGMLDSLNNLADALKSASQYISGHINYDEYIRNNLKGTFGVNAVDEGIVISVGARDELGTSTNASIYQDGMVLHLGGTYGVYVTGEEERVDIAAPAHVERYFDNALNSIFDTVEQSALALHYDPAEVQAILANPEIKTQLISLEDLDPEETAEEINHVFSTVMDELATKVAPGLVDNFQELETLGETLVRVASEVSAVEKVVSRLGLTFAETEDTLKSQTNLVKVFGGLKDFLSAYSGFSEKFLSEQQQFENTHSQLVTTFADSGIKEALPATREGYLAMVRAQDTATESGAKNLKTLLDLTDVADNYYSTLEAQESTRINDAFGLLSRSIDDQVKTMTNDWDIQKKVLETTISDKEALVSSLESFSKAVGSAEEKLNPATQLDYIKAQQEAIDWSRRLKEDDFSVVNDTEVYQETLNRLGSIDKAWYATAADYERDRKVSDNALTQAKSLADSQLTTEEQLLEEAKDTLKLAQEAYDLAVKDLNDQKAFWQKEIDAINGVDNSITTVSDAISNMKVALKEAWQSGAGDSGVSNDDINSWIAANVTEQTTVADLKQALTDAGITTSQLADAIGLTPENKGLRTDAQLSTWLAGNPNISDYHMATAMRIWGITPERLAPLFPENSARTVASLQQLYMDSIPAQLLALNALPVASDTPINKKSINTWLEDNGDLSLADVAQKMKEFGVTIEQMAQATGWAIQDVEAAYLGLPNAEGMYTDEIYINGKQTQTPTPAVTGPEESGLSNGFVSKWLEEHSDLTLAEVANNMDELGISIAQMAAATGWSVADVTNTYNGGRDKDGFLPSEAYIDGRHFRTPEAISSWLQKHGGSTLEDVAHYMDEQAITAEQMAAATGWSVADVTNTYNGGRDKDGFLPSEAYIDGRHLVEDQHEAIKQAAAPAAPSADVVQAPVDPVAAIVYPSDGGHSDDEVSTWLDQNDGASDEQIAAAMLENGVTIEQMARVAQTSAADIRARYNAAINGSHANGLESVPFDGYVAQLHKGEMVLPTAQSDYLRSGETAKQFKSLADQVEALRSENKALLQQIAKSTKDNAQTTRMISRGQPVYVVGQTNESNTTL